MASASDITKDILIKAMEEGYLDKLSASYADDAAEKNLETITTAYKTIYAAVRNPDA